MLRSGAARTTATEEPHALLTPLAATLEPASEARPPWANRQATTRRHPAGSLSPGNHDRPVTGRHGPTGTARSCADTAGARSPSGGSGGSGTAPRDDPPRSSHCGLLGSFDIASLPSFVARPAPGPCSDRAELARTAGSAHAPRTR